MSETYATGDEATAKSLRRELRLAPIMTGGTSLAVWIGGVTAELYDVVNRPAGATPNGPDDVYGTLLALTETDAIIDIVTGTSAGGLNGVMLSVAWATHAPTQAVTDLREVWMRLGNIDNLLRKPSERHPPSLLAGDDSFWGPLTEVLEWLARSRGAAMPLPGGEKRATRLLTTVTSVVGEPTRRSDDLGQELNEKRYAHVLTFSDADIDGAQDPDWASRLALAARSSASIPAVFEASYLPVDEEVRGRPSFGTRASFRVARWVMDGGVLDNKPIGIALDEIFQRPAAGEIRRVILYVNPTPEKATVAPADDITKVPSLREVLAAANRAPKNEEIAKDLRRLRDANREAKRAVDVRLALADLIDDPVDLDLIAAARAVYPRFRALRAETSVESMLDQHAPYELSSVAERAAVARSLKDAVGVWLGDTGDLEAVLPDSIGPTDGWTWGIAPLDYSAAMLFDLLTRALRMRTDPPTDSPAGSPEPVGYYGMQQRDALGQLRERVGKCVKLLEDIRREDRTYWRNRLGAITASTDLAVWAAASYAAWPAPLRPRLAEIARHLAGVAVEFAWTVGPLVRGEIDRGIDRDEVGALSAHIALLGPAVPSPLAPADGTETIGPMVAQLVGLHILAVAMGDTARRPQPVGFIEVSTRAPSAVDPGRTPEDKVAGTEFNRLGAFVKTSWRANDWMWGRLDGAYQLVLLLLDPARLRQLRLRPDDVVSALDLGANEQIEDAARQELRFLLDDTRPAPASLPVIAGVLAERVQTRIAFEELPHVHRAVLVSRDAGAAEGDGGDFRRAYEALPLPFTPDAAARLLPRCRIGAEGQADEVGQDALTRSAGRAIAVAGNALTGDHSGLGLPARVGSPLRQLGLVTYALTQLTTTASRTALAIAAVVFGSAAAVLGMALLGTDVNAGLVFLAAAVLIVGLILSILRSGLWSQLPLVLALLAVSLALMGEDFRAVIVTPAGGREFAWKQTYFLNSFSVLAVVLALVGVVWIVTIVDRRRAARTESRRAVQFARATGRPVPSTMQLPNLLVPVVVVLGGLVAQHFVVRRLLTGDDRGVRAALGDAADALGRYDVLVVLVALVFVGVFVGVAWDRVVRPLLPRLDFETRTRVARISPETVRKVTTIAAVIAAVTLIMITALSSVLADDGSSYREFQVAGSHLDRVIAHWPSGTRWVAGLAVGFDIVFALSYGVLGAVVLGRAATTAAARNRDRAELRAALFVAAAWGVLLGATFDLLENVGLVVALALHGFDASATGVGSVVRVLGLVKSAVLAAALLAALGALASMLPGHHEVAAEPDPATTPQ